MKKYMLAIVVGVGLVGASSCLLNTRPIAAQTQQSTAVFDAGLWMEAQRRLSALGAGLEQLGEGDVESEGDACQHEKRRIGFATFEAADVSAVDAGDACHVLL